VKSREEIIENWLPRYTGTAASEIGQYILLTNFSQYVKLFAEWYDTPIRGADRIMPSATSDNISIINFGMGSPNAATIMDLLSVSRPKAVLFLGKCGGLKK
jgi:AMP nucleosidase